MLVVLAKYRFLDAQKNLDFVFCKIKIFLCAKKKIDFFWSDFCKIKIFICIKKSTFCVVYNLHFNMWCKKKIDFMLGHICKINKFIHIEKCTFWVLENSDFYMC